MTSRGQQLGQAGEAAAERYLRSLGYKILHRNLRLGKLGEIDLVAMDRTLLVLAEVKTRLAGEVLGGFGNITAAKQRKLRDLGQAFLQRSTVQYTGARFDAIEVEFAAMDDRSPVVRHVLDAFR